MVTTVNKNTLKKHTKKTQQKGPFFPEYQKVLGLGPLQELEVRPHSGPYLLIYINQVKETL